MNNGIVREYVVPFLGWSLAWLVLFAVLPFIPASIFWALVWGAGTTALLKKTTGNTGISGAVVGVKALTSRRS